MQAERWQRIKELLDVSLRLDPAEREEYLTRVCEGDAGLRQEVESLVDAHEEAGDLFERPILGTPVDPMIGARLGPYEITELIGTGGMGSVYRAVRADEIFEKEVSIKLLRQGLDLDSVIRHFRQERQIMASLDHPNIASLLDGGTTPDGLPYFVMEFIRGKPIDLYCDEKGLGIRPRLELFRQVCSAVEFAHRRGVVHRDIKPTNILVTENGIPKLLDFGIAKILNPDSLPVRESLVTIGPVMTPDYASPEQLNRQPVSAASDVFSLGVVLCELLSGSRPYAPRTPFRREATTSETPMLPSRLARRRDLAGDLDSIVLMAVRDEPEKRYRSAGRLEEDIGRYLEARPVMARRQGVVYRFSKFVRRQRAAVASVAVTVAAAALVFGVAQVRERVNGSSSPPQIVPVTSMPGEERQPALSPDGKRVAYVWSGDDGANADIYLQSLGGGDVRRITNHPDSDVSPAWSPGSSEIAWLRVGRDQAAVWLAKVSDGTVRKLADVFPNREDAIGRQLDWSPDGEWIAVTEKASREQPFRIVLVNVKTGSKRELTQPPDQTIGDLNPAFSQDGNWVAFLRAASSGVNDIYTVPAGGGPAQRITFDNRYIVGLAWTPARAIVFSSERGGNAALWQVPLSGGTPVRLPLVGPNAMDPAVSRDGRRLVYAQVVSDANIWRVETGGRSTPMKLIASTQYDSSPQYSPDGRHVAFRSNRSGSHEIWVADSDGGNARQITHFDGALTGTPRWSPDGKQIALDSRPEGEADIYTIPSDGGAPHRITADRAEDVVPSWSGDGRWIYFASNRSGVWQVWRTPAAGGSAEQVTTLGGFAALESPDHRYLYYAKGRDVAGLWRKRLPNGVEEPVIEELRAGFWGYWSVTGKGIYFVDQSRPGAPAAIFFYDLARKQKTEVVRLEKPAAITDSAFAISPDGRFILFTQLDQSGSDIVMIDHYQGRL